LMCPLLPCLVRSSIGLNHWISSLLKNMYRITADFLLILKGCPLKTILLHTTLLGSTLYSDPRANSWCVSVYIQHNVTRSVLSQ
jgi:hypothetical protein